MSVINQLSLAVSSIALIVVMLYGVRARRGVSGAEKKTLQALVFLSGAVASIFASALSIATQRFWVYSITMGLVIFILIFFMHKIMHTWED